MLRQKRHIDTIDLTDDCHDRVSSSQTFTNPSSSQGYTESQPTSSEPRPAKHARVENGYGASQPYHIASGGSQADALLIDDDDEHEEKEDDVVDLTREKQYQYHLYGILPAKIVGCRYYNGYATIGEMVVLRREPYNQYDSNAIQVLNVQGEQIGHIPRNIAAKLANYLDKRSIVPEGFITGHKGHFECPIDVRLYGTNEPIERENLIQQLKVDGLPIGHAKDRIRKEANAEKERRKLAAQDAKNAKKNGGAVVSPSNGIDWDNPMGVYAGGSSQGLGLGPSLEDIIGESERFNPRNMDQVVEQFGVKEEDLAAMPEAPQPKAMLTQLHPFQLQGLQWMLQREDPKLPARGTKEVVQLWQRHPTMPDVFTNLATNFSITNPSLASGGILADDMGLGKTIQVISLIMADRENPHNASRVSNATLILAPVSVMSNWSSQMKKHIKKKYALRVMFYHGTRKQPINPETIKDYDVVISTYDSVSSEWYSQKSTKLPRRSGVFSVTWRRIILDEGHNIRNPKAKKTVAVTNLLAQSRWALTGTPIINNLKDLYSLVRFLGLSGGLDTFDIFHSAIIRPVMQGDGQGSQALQLLMAGICLRRKKEMSFIDLRLPDLSEYVHKINLHPHEQEKYDALEAQAKGTLDIYRSNLMGRKNASDMYRHLLEVLLRMRQLCNHWKLVGEERLESIMKQLEAEGVVDLTEENKVALQKMLQLSIDSQEDCPICLDQMRDPVITKCAHIFCTPCIERVVDTQHKCPMCRVSLDSLASTTVKPAKETATPTLDQLKDEESIASDRSSKVSALLSILHASSKDPSTKTIVFSQWTSFLDILQSHLQAAGYKFVRIDGSMTAPQRDDALDALDTDDRTTIMLASLSVCSVGLNLVAANQVILADSWWAPAIEDQAVDRVHRLGQKRETKVFRLVVEGSVEERVLGIQNDKRRLMSLAFAEKVKKKRAGAGLADLERLLGGEDREGREMERGT
ncbi:hypothetical protein CC78DRAFT_513897 [Lojkania enalia]|uniref:Uncharacterized protein n=1 Tax=Lojkania enalia TaxID=147567 RepID=A0A9P4KH85_9PLEO|nr:hypothetical protein CC78DRAFT_513897 [Didymosphaeria enalia]